MKHKEEHIDPFKKQFSKLTDGELAVDEKIYDKVLKSIPSKPKGLSERVLSALGKKSTVRLLVLSLGVNLLTIGAVLYNWRAKTTSNVERNIDEKNNEHDTNLHTIEESVVPLIKTSSDSEIKSPHIQEKKENDKGKQTEKNTSQLSNIKADKFPKPAVNRKIESTATPDKTEGKSTGVTNDKNADPDREKNKFELVPDTMPERNKTIVQPTEEEIQEKEKDPSKYGIKGFQIESDSTEHMKIWKKKN